MAEHGETRQNVNVVHSFVRSFKAYRTLHTRLNLRIRFDDRHHRLVQRLIRRAQVALTPDQEDRDLDVQPLQLWHPERGDSPQGRIARATCVAGVAAPIAAPVFVHPEAQDDHAGLPTCRVQNLLVLDAGAGVSDDHRHELRRRVGRKPGRREHLRWQ